MLELPPDLCLTSAELKALGTPGLRTVFTMCSLGTAPCPNLVGSCGTPNNSLCIISLVVSLLSPAAQTLTGWSNVLPSHHLGYNPVMW